MSTPAQHNDDMFRQSLENYREMPSDKVWAGVEQALDHKKKKRRFLFWIWFPGVGMAAAAALFIPLFMHGNLNPRKAEQAAHRVFTVAEVPSAGALAASHGQVPSASAYINASPSDKHSQATTQTVTGLTPNTSATHVTQTKREPGNTERGSRQVNETPAKHTTAVTAHTNDTQNTATPGEKTPQTETAVIVPVENTGRIPASGIELAQVPGERLKSTFVLRDHVAAALPLSPGLSFAKTALVFGPTSRFQPVISVQGYAGGVAYHRISPDKNTPSSPQYANTDTVNRSKRFGFYGSTVVKAGFVFNRFLYVAVGVGYETQHFADRYQFQIPGGGSLPSNDTLANLPELATDVLTNFGPVTIPLYNTSGSGTASPAQKLNGRLVYQSHHLIFPLEIGYRFSRRRVGFSIVGSAAFHVPVAQSAVFYPDEGDPRTINTNPFTRFNVSVGLEPSLECFITRRMSFLVGGSFRYQLLNAFQTMPNPIFQPPPYISRPYTLSGQVGLRFYLGK